MEIPSRSDWGELAPNDLEGKYARDSFFGKTLSEAEAMFRRNALFYQEELQSLPTIPFNFYAPALVAYLLSSNAKGDADGASSFLRMVIWMLKTHREIIAPETECMLVQASRTISERQTFYAASESIYGRFSDLYTEMQGLSEYGA